MHVPKWGTVSLIGCALVHRLHLFKGIRHRDAHDAHAFIVNLANFFGRRALFAFRLPQIRTSDLRNEISQAGTAGAGCCGRSRAPTSHAAAQLLRIRCTRRKFSLRAVNIRERFEFGG